MELEKATWLNLGELKVSSIKNVSSSARMRVGYAYLQEIDNKIRLTDISHPGEIIQFEPLIIKVKNYQKAKDYMLRNSKRKNELVLFTSYEFGKFFKTKYLSDIPINLSIKRNEVLFKKYAITK